MLPGLPFGTNSTTVLVAKVTGRVQSPSWKSACASSGAAEANTSAGAPCSICSCSSFEPEKLYVLAGAIFGNASRSEDAA